MKNKIIVIGLVLLIIVVIIVMYFVLRANNKVEENNGNIVISYESSPSYGSIEELNNHYIINVYDNMVVEYGHINDSKLNMRNLGKEIYEETYKYAFSDEFTNLEENLTDEGVMDGYSCYITIYYKDGSSKKVGGFNPSNTTYKELEYRLLTLTEK